MPCEVTLRIPMDFAAPHGMQPFRREVAPPLRVLNIMLAKVKGGVETMALLYHRALRDRGFEVLSVGHPDGVLVEGLPAGEVRAVTAHVNHDPLAFLALRSIVATFKPDIVLTHGNRAAGLALLPFSGMNDRTVVVLHNDFFKAHLRRARAAFCVSANVREAAAKALPGVPLSLVPNFTDLAAYPVRDQEGQPPVIGALGRLHEQKGFDVLLRAAAILRDRDVPFHLRIAGEGPDRALLEGLIHDNALDDQAELLGWVSPPGPFLATLDLFAVPSRYEPFGLVVIEAMAAGVPVVASDLEGPREILEQGRLGFLVDSEDPEKLADRLAEALRERRRAVDLARTAQAHAMAAYGFEAGADRLAAAVHGVN